MAVLSEHIKMDQALNVLQQHKDEWKNEALSNKINLLEQVILNLKNQAEKLALLTNEKQRIPAYSMFAGEVWGGAIWAIAATLQGYKQTLEYLSNKQLPHFSHIANRPNGQLKIRIYPNNLIEKLILNGIVEEAWMKPGITRENLNDHIGSFYRNEPKEGGVVLVLGAGNVVSIPVLDIMHKLYVEGQVVIMKMNPVNDYAGHILEKVMAPFIKRGFLRLIYGGQEEGEYLVAHPKVDSIHLTGSLKTHDAIVYGSGQEGLKNKQNHRPVLKKPVTSELGGVGPVIVLPGKWSQEDLRYQAENIVSMKMYNDGFICVAAQILIIPEKWDQKDELLDQIRVVLSELPARYAYYPGVKERYLKAIDGHDQVESFNGDVPATLITDLDPQNDQEYLFREEVFAPVYGVVCLPGDSLPDYLDQAIYFCNEKLFGSLGANIIGHPQTLKDHEAVIDQTLEDLKYGSIGLNVWNAVAFLLPYTPWGAYPVEQFNQIESGQGKVHNAFFLEGTEKTVVKGSFYPFPRSFVHMDFTMLPKPAWFVTNKNSLEINKKVALFTIDQDWKRLPGLNLAAMKG
ncbi:MAG: aldehyde dehydrogenase family protein [Candidatus Cyclobacteriaceae bacterium M3_2C_046]